MRTISNASLEKLAQKTGTEPVCIIECEWEIGQQPAVYGDKKVAGVDARILQVANLDDVVNVSKNGVSQSVTITMDDTDGQLKNIFNLVDLHKKRVSIYQWFEGISLNDKFLMFSGQIMSPVVWKEGDRTLTFTVSSQMDDIEVGFSPEEGDFPNLPQNMVGTVWPLVFGTVAKLGGLRIDDIPYGGGPDNKTGTAADSVTTDGTGIKDPALEPAIKDNENNAGFAAALAQVMFIGYLQASFTAREHGELGFLDPIDAGTGQFSQLAKQYLSQGNNYLQQAQRVRQQNTNLKTVKLEQEKHEKKIVGVTNGAAFPQGRPMNIDIGGATHRGNFLGNEFHINNRVHPDNEIFDGLTTPDPTSDDVSQATFGRTKFFYADAGIPLHIGQLPDEVIALEPGTHIPVRYILAATIQVSVTVLYAYRTYNDVKSLYPIPSNFYTIYQLMFGTLPVTMAYFYQPLSSRIDLNGKSEGWEDEVLCTCTSPIGPNTVDIIRWLIETYTQHEIDEESFGVVRDLVDNYPSHFAVTDRPQVISLVSQIARQARCLVWLKNNKFYIKYMPTRATSIATITEADVIEQSLEVSYTESEDLNTKIVASWRPDYISKPNLVVLRYNIKYYGMHERRDNYFIYNMQQLVEKSATFWLIREANTFKRVTLKVPIKHLNIETLDTVTLNFSNSYVANGPIDCVVEQASIDTNDYTIQLTLWVPVRAGEMTEYNFAWTGDLTIEYVFPTPDDINSGRAGSGNDVPFNRDVTLPNPAQNSNSKVTQPFSGDKGNGGQIHITRRRQTWGADPKYTPDHTPLNQTPPVILTRVDTTGVKPLGTKPKGTTKYQINRPKVKKEEVRFEIRPAVYPGRIVSGSGDTYTCKIYRKGLDKPADTLDNVKVLQIDSSETIPVDTWVFIHSTVYKDGKNKYVEQWYIQPPIWI